MTSALWAQRSATELSRLGFPVKYRTPDDQDDRRESEYHHRKRDSVRYQLHFLLRIACPMEAFRHLRRAGAPQEHFRTLCTVTKTCPFRHFQVLAFTLSSSSPTGSRTPFPGVKTPDPNPWTMGPYSHGDSDSVPVIENHVPYP